MPGVQWLGDVSYSVYLWHWPLIVLAPIVPPPVYTPTTLTVLMLTILLAWLSKLLIEDPVRAGGPRAPNRALDVRLRRLATGLVLAVSASGSERLEHAGPPGRRRVAAPAGRAAALLRRRRARSPSIRAQPEAAALRRSHADRGAQPARTRLPVIELEGPRLCLRLRRADGRRRSQTVALIGDSHAGALARALETVAQRTSTGRACRSRHTGCPLSKATKNLPEPARSTCVRGTRRPSSGSPATPRSDRVRLRDRRRARRGRSRARPARRPARRLRRRLERAAGSVKHIVVLARHAQVAWATPTVRREALNHAPPRGSPARCRARRCTTTPPPSRRAGRCGRVSVARPDGLLLRLPPCYPVIGGVLAYKDTTHLTEPYAQTLGPYLRRAVDGVLTPAGAG